MGGRGSGGRRAGSGRKPKDALLRSIQGGRSRIPAPSASHQATSALQSAVNVLAPPADMDPAEAAIWERDAPLAQAQGTLTPSMVGAFRAYCEVEALCSTMLRAVRGQLVTSDGGVHPLLTQYRGAVQRVQSMRKDFKLSPFGKEEVLSSAAAETPGSRLAAFASRRA